MYVNTPSSHQPEILLGRGVGGSSVCLLELKLMSILCPAGGGGGDLLAQGSEQREHATFRGQG